MNRTAMQGFSMAEFKAKRKERIWNKTNGCCWYCGDETPEGERSLDHIIPRASGGSDDEDNLAPSCKRCNVQKGQMSLTNFRNDRLRRRHLLSRDHPLRQSESAVFAYELHGWELSA